MGPNQLCNGNGAGRQCYNFTAVFRESFNSWHDWATNYTQDMLSKTTGGPEIQGPYARMGAADACSFDSIREEQAHGQVRKRPPVNLACSFCVPVSYIQTNTRIICQGRLGTNKGKR
jgi:hypothetical protein